MPQPSAQDFLQAFDPSAYTSITGAQLLQYITGAAPFTDKGMIVWTTDVAGNPTVPNANTTTKWKLYIWGRIGASAVSLYSWNPNGASDATYLQWVGINTSGIPAASIQGYQIAANTITDSNIAGVNYSKIAGIPTSLPPSGVAGPTILSGTYPDPSITNGAITSAMLANNAIKGGASNQLGVGANGVDLLQNVKVPANSNTGSPAGGSVAVAANDRVVLGVGATNFVTVQKVIDALAEPAVGNALMDVQVNTAGTGFQYSAHKVLQSKVYSSAVKASGSGTIVTTSTPNYNATGVTAFFNTASDFVVQSASSVLIVEVVANLDVQGSTTGYLGVYNATGATAPVGFTAIVRGSGAAGVLPTSLQFSFASPGTGALTFYVAFGGTGTSHTNSNDGSTSLFGGIASTIRITEYL